MLKRYTLKAFKMLTTLVTTHFLMCLSALVLISSTYFDALEYLVHHFDPFVLLFHLVDL